MNGVVCLAQADADTYSAAIDVKLGYPKAGVDVGAGLHAPPAQSITQRYGNVKRHPTLTTWAFFPSDAITEAQAVAKPVGSVTQALDATWFP